MKRRLILLLTALLVATTGAAPGATAAPTPPDPVAAAAPDEAAEQSPAQGARPGGEPGPSVFVGELSPADLGVLAAEGLDRTEVRTGPAGTAGRLAVEVLLTPRQVAKLATLGVVLTEKTIGGADVSDRLSAQATSGWTVFRSYSEPGGLRDELVDLAAQYPDLTELVTIGTSVQGQDILAVRVTRDADRVPDGRRPAVLYASAQHAREWITPEMTRRLLRHYLEGYATDPAVRDVVDTTELWFVPVANPDGYDYSFTEGNRLWRKNLRDNDGDGVITAMDGVDLNRNFPTRWGYDNEGSSPSWASDVYRGTAPASEPETRALDDLMARVGFEFLINYHSAAELLLYGVGWQVATPSPDDLLYETLAGDDATPAVPGYDPDISAELYTTNGETTEHAQTAYGTLAFTPEMTTCETASALDPDDEFEPEACESGFNFPDSEALVQAEFEKNLPFAIAVAQSAQDPDDPVSVVGRTAPDFLVDSFDVSYGDPQTVAVTARRDLRGLVLHYSVNDGRTRHATVREWRGGERYGGTNDRYYAEFRGRIRGTEPGDEVRVWFTGHRLDLQQGVGGRDGRRTSESFTYRVAEDAERRVLVLANEDVEGVNPTYPESVTGPKYADDYVDALAARGLDASVWDVSSQGVPHHLGVLDHFDGVVWHLGDNRLTQDPEDELTDFFGEPVPDAAVAERQQYLTLAVRDYLNEGGRLLHTGETTGYYGPLASFVGGLFYGQDGAPEQDCVFGANDCLILADDFTQYYLGALGRATVQSPTAFRGEGDLAGVAAPFGGPALDDNPLDEAGSFTVTSDVLPVEQFPQFASQRAGTYVGGSGSAFEPVEGSWYVGGVGVSDSYMRLVRTIDLTGVAADDVPQLRAQLSFSTEPGYDGVLVEAHAVGTDDWTTLPDAGGLTTTDVPPDCAAGFLTGEHPFLLHYLTPTQDSCTASGTTGEWNYLTGDSGGWQPATFDLSAFAGRQVEVSISFVTDAFVPGLGVLVDDTAVVVDGAVVESEGFEAGLGPWSLAGPPAGSPPGGGGFERSTGLFAAAVTTEDTVLLGFGVEQLASPAARAEVLGTAMHHLIGDRRR